MGEIFLLKLIGLYLLLFISVIVLQVLAVPTILLYIITTVLIFLILYSTLKPILFEKDYTKVLEFLKKSKNPMYQFIYYYFHKQYNEAEQVIPKIRSKKTQTLNRIAVLTAQNNYKKAKELAYSLKDDEEKYSILASIALETKDKKLWEENHLKIKKQQNKEYLSIYELAYNGKKKQALEMINKRIERSKGIQLVVEIQLRNAIEEIK